MLIEDKEFLKGIKEQNNSIIEKFVALHFNKLSLFVKEHGGTKEDAEDIMQDALIILYNVLNNETTKFEKSLSVYFSGIYKKLWFRNIRDKIIHANNLDYYKNFIANSLIIEKNVLKEIEKNDRYKLYMIHFFKLNEDCRNIIEMLNEGIPVSQIIKEYNYSLSYFYKKKSLCKKELLENILNDAVYNELK